MVYMLLIGVICALLFYSKKKEKERIKTKLDIRNLKSELNSYRKAVDIEKEELEHYNKESVKKQNEINSQENLLKILATSVKSADDMISFYEESLDKSYNEIEDEYDVLIKKIKEKYNDIQDELITEIKKVRNDLDKIKETRASAQDALLKEKKIKEQLEFYCLKINQDDIEDIKALNLVKTKLHQPRILCMLIWSTYYQKPMTSLCNNVVGGNDVSGIYKITNQKTDECYIGQSVDISKRWKDHAKCGLGIDTPAANKLYKSMLEYGLENFSFEVLEKCKKELLNEKESFYIDLYDSYNFGFNSNTGVKK